MTTQQETLSTKVTRLKPNLYGCRVYANGEWIVEVRTTKDSISKAIKDMLRTLDKLGFDSNMAHASRMRPKNYGNQFKFIWNR